jgi:hypothetical protein
MVEHRARLFLPDGLAGVLRVRDLRRLARVVLPLRPSEPERIEREGLVEDVHHRVDTGGGVGPPSPLRVRHRAFRGAVIAVPARLEVRRIDEPATRAGRGRESRPVTLRVEARDAPPAFAVGCGAPGVGEHLDHAARGIASRGSRADPRRHLDARGGRQLHVRDLPLAVGHRRGIPSTMTRTPRMPKVRTRAEAPYGQLQVLRVVLPVEDGDARNARERLGHVHHRARVADHLGVAPAEIAAGTSNASASRACRRDDDGLERDRRRVEHYSALMFASLKSRA